MVVGVAFATDASLAGLTVETGLPPQSVVSSGSLLTPAENFTGAQADLQPGQVLVGKSIAYNNDSVTGVPDGTITVTLSAWANTYVNDDGVVSNPLIPLSSGSYLMVTDDIGVFALESALPVLSPPGQTLSLAGGTITWNITDQSLLMGAEPLVVEYTLTVVDPPVRPPYILDFWYPTGTAEAFFEPAHDNPYYWTMEEVTADEFQLSMNWNNGNGLNNGAIIDNDLGITVAFPANVAGQNENPYAADGSMNTTTARWNYWPQTTGTRNQAATVVTPLGTQYYSWHLSWHQGSPGVPKTYIFTVKDLAGPGLDVQYLIDFPSGGGSQAFSGGKIIVSTDYFQKTYNSGTDDPFNWDGTVINQMLGVKGQIRLIDPNAQPPTFQLDANKVFASDDNHNIWGMNNDTVFYVTLQDSDTGFYLVFTDNGDGTFAYSGLAASSSFANIGDMALVGMSTQVPFSVNNPATLLDIPTEDAGGILKTYTMAETSAWEQDFNHPPSVSVSYSIDGASFAQTASISSGAGEEVVVTVQNSFDSEPSGYLRLLKLFDGFPSDWGITATQEFTVKVWDSINENYLLFVSPDTEALDPGSGWDRTNWGTGTLYCVGNDGGTSGTAVISDSYWNTRIQADPNLATSEISLRLLQTVGLSNIWPGEYEIHELDFEGNLLSTSPANSWWQYYVNFQQITRDRLSPPGTFAPNDSYIAFIVNYFQQSTDTDPAPNPDDPGLDPDPNPNPDPPPNPHPQPPPGGGNNGGDNNSNNNKSGNNGDLSDGRGTDKTPITGDSSSANFWIVLMVTAVLLVFVTALGLSEESKKQRAGQDKMPANF